MTTTPETRSDRTSGPIHGHFGLTYAQYQVLNRTLMQSMPVEWQERMVGCLDELHAAFEHVEQPESYIIKPAREATYSDLTDAQMRLLGVGRPVGNGEDGDDDIEDPEALDVYYDDEGVEHSPDDRVYIPTGADPIPHYRRGYVEPNIPTPVEGAAVTREPSDIWQAVLTVGGWTRTVEDVAVDDADLEVRVVRRSAVPVGERLPAKHSPHDVAHTWSDFGCAADIGDRFAQAQAIAAGLNAAEATR